jgi:CRISPR-associated protein Cas1
MIKRTIEISGYDTHLSVKHNQIIVTRSKEQVAQIPAEDIGLLIIDTPFASYSHGTLTKLIESGAAVVLCGNDHHPAGMIMPVEAHSIQTERFRAQINAKNPLKKRLWQQVVQKKIQNQAALLDHSPVSKRRLLYLSQRVRSGDPDNTEGQAARLYWEAWLQAEHFRRLREGPWPNNLLNYGYMVLRASVARAICGSGLHPSIGIKHRNRYNAFCLADDLMEPLRPLVDAKVRDLYHAGECELTREVKSELLSILTQTCISRKGSTHKKKDIGPLMVGLERMAASLCSCFEGKQSILFIPDIL